MIQSAQKIVLPGGSGFLGRKLARWFSNLDCEIVLLTRRPGRFPVPAREVKWDGATLGDWRRELEGATAVVNLAGRSVNCRYHARNRRDIWHSRVDSTRVLGEAISRCVQPPTVWLNSSTATIYKHSFDKSMDEMSGVIGSTPEAKDIFSVEVAQAWERAFTAAQAPEIRKVALRTAVVLSMEPGTAYRALRRVACLGLGGAMAGGAQYVSWIHETDFCRAVEWLVSHDRLSGSVNLASPQPLPNREFMRLIRQACGVSRGLPAARWMLEVGALLIRTETELLIKSRRVVPGRLAAAGFDFRFPELSLALQDLEQGLPAKKMTGNVASR